MKNFLLFVVLLLNSQLHSQCNNFSFSIYKADLQSYSVETASNGSINAYVDGPSFKLENNSNFGIEYASAVWIGGKTSDGELKMSHQFFNGNETPLSSGYLPDDGTAFDMCDFWDTTFIVSQYEVNKFRNDYNDNNQIDNPIVDEIKYYPAIGNPFFEEKYGVLLPESNIGGLAPFIDLNSDNIYNPENGDYPEIIGSINAYNFSQDLYPDPGNPLGIEMMNLSGLSPLSEDSTITLKNKIRVNYQGQDTLYDAYVGIWSDVDIICYDYSFAGCLPDENLVFMHGDYTDGCLFPSLDAEEMIFFSTPIYFIEAFVNDQPMNSFITLQRPGSGNYPPGTFYPETDQEYYNTMQGKWRDGLDITYGGTGYNIGSTDVRKFIFDYSDNADPMPWKLCESEASIGDKHIVIGFGPMTLVPDEIVNIELNKYLAFRTGKTCFTEEELLAEYDRIVNAEIVSTKDVKKVEPTLIVSPNPFNSTFQVECAENILKLDLFDLNGTLLYTSDNINSTGINIDTETWAQGTYILVVTTKYSNQIKKIVKQ